MIYIRSHTHSNTPHLLLHYSQHEQIHKVARVPRSGAGISRHHSWPRYRQIQPQLDLVQLTVSANSKSVPIHSQCQYTVSANSQSVPIHSQCQYTVSANTQSVTIHSQCQYTVSDDTQSVTDFNPSIILSHSIF